MPGYPRLWYSPTFGQIHESAMVRRIRDDIVTARDNPYRIMIGTDSMPNPKGPVYLVTAIVVHRIGHGGIYFWQRKLAGPFPSLRHRMRAEADRSLRQARHLMAHHVVRDMLREGVSIHLDIGNDGASRDVIREVVAMVTHFGLAAAIKPEAVAASRVAHRHTAVPNLALHPA
jgi:predicted RNase H-related nuclease YkuK (DUF458 family)